MYVGVTFGRKIIVPVIMAVSRPHRDVDVWMHYAWERSRMLTKSKERSHRMYHREMGIGVD